MEEHAQFMKLIPMLPLPPSDPFFFQEKWRNGWLFLPESSFQETTRALSPEAAYTMYFQNRRVAEWRSGSICPHTLGAGGPTCTEVRLKVMTSCEVGLMKGGGVTERFPCSKMR